MKSEKPLLGEFIKELAPTKRIRIGCKPGGGFIYEGIVADLNLNSLYRKCALSIAQKVYDNMETFATANDHKKLQKTIQPIVDKFYNMKPLPVRKVLMDYPGQFEPDVRVIIIEGDEKLFEYDPDIPPLVPERMHDTAAQDLIEAIYANAAEELTNSIAIMKRTHGDREGDREKKNSARATAQHVQKWIRSDPYGILDQPDGIVRACQARAMGMVENNEISMKKRK